MNPRHPRAPSPFADFSIGPKLKALRAAKGLTLSRLGSETGLSTALLSKLESELMVPTLSTLAKISRVYGVNLAHFFATITQHSLALTRHAHIADIRRESPAAREIPLHHINPRSRQVSKILELPEGGSCTIGDPGVRTELTAYVLEGQLHLITASVEDRLQQGDCVVIDTDSAIRCSAPETRCRVLVVFVRSPSAKKRDFGVVSE